MALSVSLDIFSNIDSGECPGDSCFHGRILYKLKDERSHEDWICTYRRYMSHEQDESDIDITALVPATLKKDVFYAFKWDKNRKEHATLQESLQCFLGTVKGESATFKEIPASDINWVENYMAEVARRGYSFVGATLFTESSLPLNNDLQLDNSHLGINRLGSMDSPLCSMVTEYLKETLMNALDFSNEELAIEISDRAVVKASNSANGLERWCFSFGANNECSKHVHLSVLPREDEEESYFNVGIRILWQTVSLVPTDCLSGPSMEEVSNAVIKDFRHMLSCICGSPDACNYLRFLITPQKVNKREVSKNSGSKAVSKPKGNNKGGKGKSSAKSKKPVSQESKPLSMEILDSNAPFRVKISKSERMINMGLTFDRVTGNITVKHHDNIVNESTGNIEKIMLHSVIKCFLPYGSSGNSSFAAGGAMLSLPDLIENDKYVATCFSHDNPGNHMKLLMDPRELSNRNILVEPHPSTALFPQWMNNKTSRSSSVKGFYQYYHYLQCAINDNGWGCCYRSIQVVSSWYLLQHYTVNPVPTHSQIQTYLKERDPSHTGLVVGSKTWIGTVEAGYFINWYLNFNTKTLYLADVNELRNYNGVIASHFERVGTPIIMGAGLYAYVIVGICMEIQGGVAYLIADPHYTGEDSVKDIRTKGAIGWKKVDFIAKAANGGFINLCCPQLEPYKD